METVIWLMLVFTNPTGESVDFVPFPDMKHCELANARTVGVAKGLAEFDRKCVSNATKEQFTKSYVLDSMPPSAPIQRIPMAIPPQGKPA